MTSSYLPKCGCGAQPAMIVTSTGAHVLCQACGRATHHHRRQAGAAEEWREMTRDAAAAARPGPDAAMIRPNDGDGPDAA